MPQTNTLASCGWLQTDAGIIHPDPTLRFGIYDLWNEVRLVV